MKQPLSSDTFSSDAGPGYNRWIVAGAIAAMLLMYFLYLGGWAYFDADEGRYGNVPREMLVNSDWVTPTQNHVKFFDKPPLLYWGIAASYAVFGFQEWAGRLVPTLAALLGVFFAWVLGRRMFGKQAGFLAAIILATSLMWPLLARVVVTDMLVSSLAFVALAFWWLGHTEVSRTERQTLWFLGFWSTLALGALAKGPVIFVLCGGAIFFYMLICRQWRALGQMRWLMGVPVFLLIAAPWYILVAARNPEFNHFFWYDQNLARFLGRSRDNDHEESFTYFFKFLPLIFFPWSVFAPVAIVYGIQKLREQPAPEHDSIARRATIFLLSGTIFITLFFSASSSKLVTYILPIIPLMAILLAAYFDRLLSSPLEKRRALFISAGVLGVLLLGGGGAVFASMKASPELEALGISAFSITAIAVLLAFWGLAIVFSIFKKRASAVIFSTASGFAAFFVALLPIIAGVAPQYTTEPLIQKIRAGLTPQAQIITFPYTQSVSFYANRRVYIIGSPSEMGFGMDQLAPAERSQWILAEKSRHESDEEDSNFDEEKAGIIALKAKLNQSVPVYCFLRPERDEPEETRTLLNQLRGIADVVAFNQRFIVIGNRAALTLTPAASTLPALLTF